VVQGSSRYEEEYSEEEMSKGEKQREAKRLRMENKLLEEIGFFEVAAAKRKTVREVDVMDAKSAKLCMGPRSKMLWPTYHNL
jgi:hypothetical protein